jgi:hypothetical protein
VRFLLACTMLFPLPLYLSSILHPPPSSLILRHPPSSSFILPCPPSSSPLFLSSINHFHFDPQTCLHREIACNIVQETLCATPPFRAVIISSYIILLLLYILLLFLYTREQSKRCNKPATIRFTRYLLLNKATKPFIIAASKVRD